MASATAVPSRAPDRTPALDWPPSPTLAVVPAAPVPAVPRPPSSLPLVAGAGVRSFVDGDAAPSPTVDAVGGSSTTRGSGRGWGAGVALATGGDGSGAGRTGSGATGGAGVSTRRVSAGGSAGGGE